MRFDVENTGKCFFDDRQTLTLEEWDDFKDAYVTEEYEILKKTVSEFKDKEKRSKSQYFQPVVMIPTVTCLAMILIGILFSNLYLAIGGFVLILVWAGIHMLITGGVSKDGATAGADTACNRFTGLILALIPLVPCLLCFVILKDKATGYKVFISIGCVLTGFGIMFISRIIFHSTAKKRIYSEEVNATCIGYARYVDTSTDNEGTVSHHSMISPVFEYSYEGEHYICVYDGFTNSRDSDVKLGPTVINISPKYPEGIYNDKSESISALVIMVLVCLVIGGCLFAVAISGAYTQWKPSSSADNMVRIVDLLDRN